LLSLSLLMAISSCNKSKQSPGYEFMPDMYRSPAIEAYVDYHDSAGHHISARLPARGTIPFNENQEKAFYNFPYSYPNTIDGYEKAGAELKNPIAFSEEVLKEGEYIYKIFCQHCHGKDGGGEGSMVKSGAYPPVPSYTSAQIKDIPQGKMFHTLTYGKGNMGSHASQLSKEERWKVVHYVSKLRGDYNAKSDNQESSEN
jgi:mono/diheme cytochrome c family protein